MKMFINNSRPMLTVMLQCATPEVAIGRIRNANELGADAYGLQVESLEPQYQNPDTYKRIFAEMKDKPCYVTNYRFGKNEGKSDDELADGLVELAESGATLCDVMGDMFCRHPEEITDNDEAIEKQRLLINKIHNLGSQVLISSHIFKFVPAERILEIALEQKRRGADIIKIVTFANDMEQQIENLKITNMLKEKLDVPFLFLSNGENSIHRRLGIILGCCMSLCVYEHDALSTAAQPLLKNIKKIRDDLNF